MQKSINAFSRVIIEDRTSSFGIISNCANYTQTTSSLLNRTELVVSRKYNFTRLNQLLSNKFKENFVPTYFLTPSSFTIVFLQMSHLFIKHVHLFVRR